MLTTFVQGGKKLLWGGPELEGTAMGGSEIVAVGGPTYEPGVWKGLEIGQDMSGVLDIPDAERLAMAGQRQILTVGGPAQGKHLLPGRIGREMLDATLHCQQCQLPFRPICRQHFS